MHNIKYDWLNRRVGYTRILPDYEVKNNNLKLSLAMYRRMGVEFSLKETFAGIEVKVVSFPNRVSKIPLNSETVRF